MCRRPLHGSSSPSRSRPRRPHRPRVPKARIVSPLYRRTGSTTVRLPPPARLDTAPRCRRPRPRRLAPPRRTELRNRPARRPHRTRLRPVRCPRPTHRALAVPCLRPAHRPRPGRNLRTRHIRPIRPHRNPVPADTSTRDIVATTPVGQHRHRPTRRRAHRTPSVPHPGRTRPHPWVHPHSHRPDRRAVSRR